MRGLGFLRNISGKISRKKEKRDISSGKSPWDDYWYVPFSMPSGSGVYVDQHTAMNCSTVLACTRILSESVAGLPLHVYKRTPDSGKEKATAHKNYALLHTQPNPEMTSFQWLEQAVVAMILWGDSFNQIITANNGDILAIWPLNPAKMEIKRNDAGELFYEYRRSSGEPRTFYADEILHIPSITTDGVKGKSIIELQRESIGLALATESFGARWFKNDSRPGGVLSHPGLLSDPAREHMRKSWEEMHAGLQKSHRVAILEEGVTFTPLNIPPNDAQFLETRSFQRTEIAGWFRVPPFMIGEVEKQTSWGSGIEQQMIGFVIYTLRPWLIRIEQAINSKLFRSNLYFAEFNVDGLLRGDIKSRGEFYNIMLNNGTFSRNEVRARENMNPQPGEQGDIYTIQLNMMDLSKISEMFAPKEEPKPRASDDGDDTDEQDGERKKKLFEVRKKSAATRLRLRTVWYKNILAFGENLVKTDNAAIKAQINKNRSERDKKDFIKWLERYFETRRNAIHQSAKRIFQTYANEIGAAAAGEIGETEYQIEKFVEAYAEAFTKGYIGGGIGQLDALQDMDEIEERVKEWDEKRPAKIADRETVQLCEAIVAIVFVFHGYQLVWATSPGACELCLSLEGKVVGKEGVFVPEGGTIDPKDGKTEPITVSTGIRHPQLHRGCACFLVAG